MASQGVLDRVTAAAIHLELTILDHRGEQTRRVIHSLPAIFGRDEQAEVPLADPWVSHRHCEIEQVGHALVIRDLFSKNGVFLHGHRVREAAITAGDRLTVGRTHITVHCGIVTETTAEAAADDAGAGASERDGASDGGADTQVIFY